MSDDPVALAYREHWSRLLALLVRQVRSFDLAEETLADAFTTAVDTWPRDGVPDRPDAWLFSVARRRAIDRLRREATLARKLPLLVTDEVEPEDDMTTISDERLRLIFTCAHPALAPESRIALTLRMVGGLTTPEIARAFLVSEPTMAARITRAKKKIAAAGIPYRVPADAELPQRLHGVLTVLYLVFTEGYAASSGASPVRVELAAEAIHLARVLVSLMPDEPEAVALLALMLVQHSRRDARLDADGRLVLLADQDRSAWHAREIAEALTLLDLLRGEPGTYELQARIAAEHTRPTTDWARIRDLYAALDELTDSPVVRLNRAVAVAEADGPEAALDLLDGLEDALQRNHLFFATRAELLHRLGRDSDAVADYDRALNLARTDAERTLLQERRDNVTM